MIKIIKSVSCNKSVYRLVVFIDGLSKPSFTKYRSIHQRIYKPIKEYQNYTTIIIPENELKQYGELFNYGTNY